MTSFPLPLYAITGAQKGESAGLPMLGTLALAVIGPTAGRHSVNVSSGVSPKHLVPGERFAGIALLTGIVRVICDAARLGTWWSASILLATGYTLGVMALYRAWVEPLAREPAGVYKRDDGRPMPGCKLRGKSQRELKALRLLADTPASSTGS